MQSRVLPILATTLALAFSLTASSTYAQAGASASAQDKQFIHDLGEDSNYEMASARLALQKSPSGDVKAYAKMVLADHQRLQQETALAARGVQVSPVSSGSMSVSEHAELLKLKVLTGATFDQAFIKNLTSGNENIQKLEKSAAGSSNASIKKLAEHSTAIDTKHADNAKQLAAAHHVQS